MVGGDITEPVSSNRSRTSIAAAVAVFVLVLVVGLWYVKWNPYWHKAFTVAAKHTLGVSTLTGNQSAPPVTSWAAAWAFTAGYAKAIWKALALGLLVGAGIQTLLPRAWLVRVLGRTGFGTTALAGALAVPGMMCTCCASPLAVSMRRTRVSAGATLAFWLGNPVLNPAVLVFIGFALGWRWAVLRLLFGVLLVFGVAHWAGRLLPDPPEAARDAVLQAQAEEAAVADRAVFVRWLRALGELAIGLVPEYAVLVLALGAVRAWLFPAISPAVGASLWLLLVMAVAGTLFVIPTAGEVPIIQTLTQFGLGAGPSGALLIALPAVSLPSLAMMGRALPVRVLAAVSAAVAVAAMLSGLAAMALGF